MRYLDADTIREASEAYRNKIPLDQIAGRLQISVAELRQALDLPSLKPIPIDADSSVDLWAADDLNARL